VLWSQNVLQTFAASAKNEAARTQTLRDEAAVREVAMDVWKRIKNEKKLV
jgi:hypothetical protein